MARVMLILPSATYRAPGFLEAAASLGVDVVSASEQPQALEEAIPGRFVELPLDRPQEAAERIVSFAGEHPLDAVIGVDDGGTLVAALAGERLGLVHNPPSAVAATRDKAAMRAAFEAGGVPQPSYQVVDEPDPTRSEEAVLEAARGLGYPVVIKPPYLSASRGVIRADDDDACVTATRRIRAILASESLPVARLIVEQFVPGLEVALEGILRAGELEVLALFDKPDPLDGPYFEETIYVTPSRHSPADQQKVTSAIKAACDALGLVEGPVHGEARLTNLFEGGVALLEVAARTIGGKCATVLQFATGQSLEELVLEHALGKGARRHELSTRAAGVMMLPIPRSGRLMKVEGQQEARAVDGVTGLEISIPIGKPVRTLPEADRYLGFLFASGDNPARVEQTLRRAHAKLAFTIEDFDATERAS